MQAHPPGGHSILHRPALHVIVVAMRVTPFTGTDRAPSTHSATGRARRRRS
jgi:hypothetical protein